MFEQNITLGPGNGTYVQHTLEIFIMLLGAFLLGLWLGWLLWNRYKQEAEKMRLENQSLNATTEVLRTDLESHKTRLAAAESEQINLSASVASLNRNNANLRDRIMELEVELADVQARNRQVETELGLSFAPDAPDPIPLEIIDEATSNVDPIEIVSTQDAADVQAIQEQEPTLNELAAQMEAATEKEAEDQLELVSPPVAIPLSIAPTPELKSSDSKTKTTIVAAAAAEKDDLTVVEGIGPKIQMLLNQYGIFTYRQLATTEVERLKEILTAAGPQLAMHDPGTWPSQANLAANDEWENLKSIQGFLKGGKRPT
jgi:predicted flap endonuclease-1-like 5' DNA nuclease